MIASARPAPTLGIADFVFGVGLFRAAVLGCLPIGYLIYRADPAVDTFLPLAALILICVPALTAVLRGSAAAQMIVLRAEPLVGAEVVRQVVSLRRTRSFAYVCAALLLLGWVPIFIAAMTPDFPKTPFTAIYLIVLPLMRVARLLDLCERHNPSAEHEYARRLVGTNLGRAAVRTGHTQLSITRGAYIRAYIGV